MKAIKKKQTPATLSITISQDNGNNNEKEANTSDIPCGCVIELPGVATAIATARGGDKGGASKQKTGNRHQK